MIVLDLSDTKREAYAQGAREMRERAVKAICSYCRDRQPLINGEWHTLQFRDGTTYKQYCIAAPIASLSDDGGT